jgi:hypothetical protein
VYYNVYAREIRARQGAALYGDYVVVLPQVPDEGRANEASRTGYSNLPPRLIPFCWSSTQINTPVANCYLQSYDLAHMA